VIPGFAQPIVGAISGDADDKDKPSRRKKKEANREKKEVEGAAAKAPETPQKAAVESEMQQQAAGMLTPEDKKRRALVKKLTAIETLKEKSAFWLSLSLLSILTVSKRTERRGENLELTQLKKLESEAEVRKELEALGESPGR
jgi:translation initiation factor 2A